MTKTDEDNLRAKCPECGIEQEVKMDIVNGNHILIELDCGYKNEEIELDFSFLFKQ